MKKQSGFTLIELMITLTVLGLVVILGIPQLQQITSRNRLVGQINNLAADLAFARSEAVKRGLPIVLSSKNANTDWSGGWDITVNATPLRDTAALSGATTLDGGAATVQYNPDGAVNGGAFTFTMCESSQAGSTARQIVISSTGRPTLSSITCP